MFIQISFYFHPYLEKIPILTNIFQMGRNHQLVSPGEFAQSTKLPPYFIMGI